MKYNILEADLAMTLGSPEEVDPDSYCYWTGWKNHWWPADVIQPGVRFYGFDKKSRSFCVLLEVTKGGSFTYRTHKEFASKVFKLIGREVNEDDPHWPRIPAGKAGKYFTGLALVWKVIKQVTIPWPRRFHQLGWERITRGDTITEELDKLDGLKETMRKRLIASRLGQGEFREKVLSGWRGCAVTGCKKSNLLKASHIKPWKECNTRERLDPFNGIALIPNLDTAFDQGLISFQNNGRILISPNLDKETQTTLGISSRMRIKHFKVQHLQYLKYHRKVVFQE